MLASPRRLSIPLLTCLLLVVIAAAGGPVSAATPDYSTLKISEVKTNPNPDFVELVNTGTEALNLSDLKMADSDHAPVAFASGVTIQPGAYFSFDPDGVAGGFGLGAADSLTIFEADGTTEIDSYAWTTHRTPSYARCPGATDLVLTTVATPGEANDCPTPDPTKVRINEVRTNPNPDFVELLNTGTQPIEITGWKAVDNDPLHTPVVIAPAGTTIQPGAFFSFDPDALTGGFGLGAADSITIFLPDGTTEIDSYDWTSHRAPSYGRCPAGTGAFVVNVAATPGAQNSCPVPPGGENIKINEVESDPNDKIELINTGGSDVDLSGYVLRDESNASLFTIPAGTTIGADAVRVFDVNVAFGLGKGDSARLYAPGGETLLDSTTWPADTHATTWGRCPDGTGEFAPTQPTLGLPNQCGAPVDPTTVIKINEVESNGDKVADWVELTNTGNATVNISGWKILDNDPEHVTTPVVVPSGTTIAPGAYYAIYTEISQSPGFGLGGADSATLLLPDGTTVVDTYEWSSHAATTYGRCPDGTGDFTTTTTSTRGAANACSAVRINEIESSDGANADWVELVNIGDEPVDLSGWVLKDSGDADAYTFPAGSIAANGYRVVESGAGGFAFGLGAGDSVRLFGPDGTTAVESYAWTSHASQTYGRCKDGVGDFVDTLAPTKGAANACPGLDTEPWPGSQQIATADLAGTFVQDLSGLAFDPENPDILWAAQNKLGTLFKLVRSGQSWVPDTANDWGAGKDPKYLDGAGAPDTEGLTIGPDGFIYAASERNNSASGVSRMSVLRYDPEASGTSLTATDEWNLTSQIPAAGANLGLEGVTWVPDSFLVAHDFVDQSTGSAYRPSDYPLHGTGLYVVAVEDTGALHAFALDSTGGTSHRIATISSGFAHLADVTFDPERQRLWAVTDDTHDGKTSLLKVQDGAFVVAEAYDRPATMPNVNNEGFAIAPQSRCVDGQKDVVWADDGDTDGHSLRAGTITCTEPDVVPHDPSITAAVTGTRSSTGWYTSAATITFTCTPQGAPLVGDCPEPVTLSADTTGQTVTRSITAEDGGSDTVTVEGIRIDRTKPKVKITGVSRTKLYVGSLPNRKCVATDATSGVASCKITRKVTPKRTTFTAKAVDRAGNSSTTSISYRTLAYTVRKAAYKGGEFRLKAGKSYRLDGTVKASGRVYGPAKIGKTAKKAARLRSGKATVKIPRSAKVGSHWKILVKVGSTTYGVKVKVVK